MSVYSEQVQSQLMIYFFNCVYNLLYLAFVVNKFQIFHCTLNCICLILVSFSETLIFLTAKVKAITAKLLGYKKYFSKFQCITKKGKVVNVLLLWAEGCTFKTLSFLASNNYYCHENSALCRKFQNFISQSQFHQHQGLSGW